MDEAADATAKPSNGWLSRKLWFGVALQCCAMGSRWMGWIDGAQLVAWSSANALYYVGGNVGSKAADSIQAVAVAVLARGKQ